VRLEEASAGPLTVLVPEPDRVPDPGRDVLTEPDVQRQARPAEPGPQLAAAKERRQAARTRQQIDGLAYDHLLQGLAATLGRRLRVGVRAAAGTVSGQLDTEPH
jgi:hypothetical protein